MNFKGFGAFAFLLTFSITTLGGCMMGVQGSAASTSLTITATDTTIGRGDSTTVTGSGGSSPYSYFINTGVGSVDASTGEFVGTSYSDSDVSVGVLDDDGNKAYVIVHVASQYDSTSSLTLIPSATSMLASATITLNATGGTSPYTYTLVSGGGTLSSQTYTSGTSSETVTFRVTDSNGTTDDVDVQVVAMTTLGATGKVWADTNVGVTFNTKASGLDGEVQTPELVIFGIGAGLAPTDLAKAGGTCIVGGNADVLSPCAIHVPLQNLSTDGTIALAYKGTVQIVGRSATVSFDFCVRPSEPTRAYLSWASTSTLTYKDQAYDSTTLTLLGGRSIRAAFNLVDSKSGAGYEAVTVTNAKYSTASTCGMGFTSTQYVEVSD